jgi:hypothetical protein
VLSHEEIERTVFSRGEIEGIVAVTGKELGCICCHWTRQRHRVVTGRDRGTGLSLEDIGYSVVTGRDGVQSGHWKRYRDKVFVPDTASYIRG